MSSTDVLGRVRGAWRVLAPYASPYTVLLARLGLVLLAYSGLRFGFYLYNRDLFGELGMAALWRIGTGGLRFDLAAILYLNIVIVVLALVPLQARHGQKYDRHVLYWFGAANIFGIGANVVDFLYYRFTLRRTTAAFVEEFAGEPRLGRILGAMFLEHAGLWLGGVVLIAAVLWLAARIEPRAAPPVTSWRRYYAIGAAVFVVGLVLAIAGMRGGSFHKSHRPINNATAGQYVDEPHLAALVLNTPFSILRTIDKKPLARAAFFPTETQLAQVYDPVHPAQVGTPRFDNVVLLVLESFGSEHVGFLNKELEDGHYQGFTPFLDSLATKSFVFTNAFANGLKSIDGLPSIVASLPSLVEPFVLSHYANDRLHGLAHHLRRRGYETAFFHGAPNGSMGFASFVAMAGFEKYFGMTEYNNDADYDGVWGIWDEPYFQYVAKKLTELKEPFLATVFSLSSHEPYNVPAQYEGKLRTSDNPLDQSIHYTDQALEKFFAAASAHPYFQRTLFVLTADHASRTSHKEYKNIVGRFRVPLLFHAPGRPELVGRDTAVAQQLDVMPTILRHVDYDAPFVAFGNDLFAKEPKRFAVNYRDGTFQLIQGDYALHHDGVKAVALFDYRSDVHLGQNLVGQRPEIQESLERLMEAIIQQYTTRLIDDRLTAELSAHPERASP